MLRGKLSERILEMRRLIDRVESLSNIQENTTLRYTVISTRENVVGSRYQG